MSARLVFLLTLLLGSGLALLTPRTALLPGPMVAGHAGLVNDCLACHAPFRGAPESRCAACHAPDSIGLARTVRPAGWEPRPGLAGLHRSVQATDCMACHTDHAGADPASATREFEHEALADAERARCAACHDGNRPDDGLHTQAANDCAACHTTRAWTPADFEHQQFFVLDRDHDVRCATCHDQPGTFRAYTCYGCHEHTPENMAREHREEGVRNLADCARCHRSADEHEGGERGED